MVLNIRVMFVTEPLSVDSHLKIVRELTWKLRAHWYNLGEQLGIAMETRQVTLRKIFLIVDAYTYSNIRLQEIEHNHPNNAKNSFTSLLETWLIQTPPPTWTMLVEAIKSPVIDAGDVANNIEKLLTI